MCAIAMLSHTLISAQSLYEPISAISELGIPRDNDGGHILDFSRVGYRFGDKEIPNVKVVKIIKAPKRGKDATALIQGAIDEIAALPYEQRGAILLKAGLYNVDGTIHIKESGIVLRGEGTHPKKGTHIHSTSTRKSDGRNREVLISFSGEGRRRISVPQEMNIVGNALVGQFWVRVSNPSNFIVGDEVIVHAETPMALIRDLRMDTLSTHRKVKRGYKWTPKTINSKNMERIITKVSGDTLWFENPISMSILERYNGGCVFHYSCENRIEECGVEDMLLTCTYASETDENHCWTGISFGLSEHCWARNIEGKHFSGLASMTSASKNITVSHCKMTQHKCLITGGRRYSFCFSGQLSIVKDCFAADGRHDFVTSAARTNGPNVFLRCRAIRTHSDTGPHHRWASGTLYDNVVVDGAINIQDRGEMGTGHGMAGVNDVLWNCECDRYAVQSPWACGANYSIGTIGEKRSGIHKNRPNGIEASKGVHVTPQSLYEAQLEHRRKLQPGGVFDVK